MSEKEKEVLEKKMGVSRSESPFRFSNKKDLANVPPTNARAPLQGGDETEVMKSHACPRARAEASRRGDELQV